MEQTNNAPKYAFYYMISLVALIFMSLSTGMIVFQIINKKIVDAIDLYRGMYQPGVLKFGISALIISAPIYYLAMRQISRSLFSGALGKDSLIRKWLSYFVLFVSSVVMIVWLILTINNFLNGELSLKFFLKALTALSIAASVFSFYFYDSKREDVLNKKDKIVAIYAYASLTLVVIVFAGSLFAVESPAETRRRNTDNAVLDDFNTLDSVLNNYYMDKGHLPSALSDLHEDYPYITEQEWHHPSTGTEYRYRIVEDKKYELCANFLSANTENKNQNSYYNERWPHAAGEQCLTQKIIIPKVDAISQPNVLK